MSGLELPYEEYDGKTQISYSVADVLYWVYFLNVCTFFIYFPQVCSLYKQDIKDKNDLLMNKEYRTTFK